MSDILRVDSNIVAKPMLCEGSSFTPSKIPTDMLTKYIGHYSYYKYFEKKIDNDKYYTLHNLHRHVSVYLYDFKYYAIVDDSITYCYPDINGYHSRTEQQVSYREEVICCGEKAPYKSTFEIELLLY